MTVPTLQSSPFHFADRMTMKLGLRRYSSPFQTLFKRRRRRLHQPLSYRQLLFRVTVIFALVFFAFILVNGDIPRLWYQSVRNASTDFTPLLQSRGPLPAPPHPFRTFDGQHIAAVEGERSAKLGIDLYAEAMPRYRYVRHLGQGREGVVRLYKDIVTGGDVVIKSWFRQGRNPLPDSLLPLFAGKDNNISHVMSKTGREIGLRNWPTEVEATLIFSGLNSSIPRWPATNASSAVGDGLIVGRPFGESYGILPAIDYFVGLRTEDSLALTSTGREAALRKHEQQYRLPWYLVTPVVGKSLDDFVRTLPDKGDLISDVDNEYRPGLDGLLVALDRLHSKGYCHDDVKLDNIFTGSGRNEQFILGDLGNVRQTDHPYHQTVDFTGRNHWKDCRADDVRRLLMSYLQFLREASMRNDGSGSTVFDFDFQYTRKAPWTRLYWAFLSDQGGPIRVADVLAYSENEAAPIDASTQNDSSRTERFDEAGDKARHRANRWKPPLSSYQRESLRVKVDEELTCTTLRWQWAVWLWFYIRYGWLAFFPYW